MERETGAGMVLKVAVLTSFLTTFMGSALNLSIPALEAEFAVGAAFIGGLLGYLIYNGFPAKIMMGDTGSLALGAACASIAVFSKNPLLIVTSGIIFVWTSISVILQVLFFKATASRLFLMAPFHHHLELKGMKETQIVTLYFVVSMVGAALTLIFARA